MKIQHILLALLCSFALASCDYDSFEEETALSGLEDVNPFVRLLTGGAGGTSTVTVSEDTDDFVVSVESQVTVPNTDVTVTYSLGGTAEYGTIYEIEGGSAAGGTLAIPFQNESSPTAFNSEDISINFLVDSLMSESATIILTLDEVSSSNGTAVDAGQGPLRKELVITLVND